MLTAECMLSAYTSVACCFLLLTAMGCMPHQIQLSLAPKGVKIKILVMVNYFWKLMTHIDTPMNSETVPLAVGKN